MIRAVIIDRDMPYEMQCLGVHDFACKECAQAWALERYSTHYEVDHYEIAEDGIHFYWGRTRKIPQVSVYYIPVKEPS